MAHARRDGAHKLSTRLGTEFDTVVAENLHVAGTARHRHLTRTVSQARMSEPRRQLDYKTTCSGRDLLVATQFYPSSKTRHNCGTVKTKLRLSERVFPCNHCSYHADRDLNAARTLASLASTTNRLKTENTPAGNPPKTSPASSGYRPREAPTTHQAKVNATPQGNDSETLPHVS